MTNHIVYYRGILGKGDTHVGHKCGLVPEEYHLRSTAKSSQKNLGMPIGASDIQMPLLKCWCSMVDMERYDIAVCLGDSIEGPNKKEHGRGAWTTDTGEQGECAADLYSMIRVQQGQFYCVADSGYHVGPDGDGDWGSNKCRDYRT